MERKNSSYELQDYYDLLKSSFSSPVEIDIVHNKLGQDSVRVRYAISKLKEFNMYIFGYDFAVAYKFNGTTKLYERITPKQAKAIICRIVCCIKR